MPLKAGAGLTRRAALHMLAGLGMSMVASALVAPAGALAASHSGVDDAQSQLDVAEQQYNEVQSQLDQIAADCESLAQQQLLQGQRHRAAGVLFRHWIAIAEGMAVAAGLSECVELHGRGLGEGRRDSIPPRGI